MTYDLTNILAAVNRAWPNARTSIEDYEKTVIADIEIDKHLFVVECRKTSGEVGFSQITPRSGLDFSGHDVAFPPDLAEAEVLRLISNVVPPKRTPTRPPAGVGIRS